MNCGIVAIRLDFGQDVGLGHLTRCLALAEHFHSRNKKTVFITRKRYSKAEVWLGKQDIVFLENLIEPLNANWTQKLDALLTIRALEQFEKVDWVIVDSYELDACWEDVLSKSYNVAAIEDLRHREHSAAFIISESPSEFSGHLLLGKTKPNLLLGPKFSMVAKKTRTKNKLGNKPNSVEVLITYGGSDLTNESLKALEATESWKRALPETYNVNISLIIGPHYKEAQELRTKCYELGVKFHDAPNGLDEFLEVADVVLTAGGNTMVEAMGYSCIAIVTKTEINQVSLVEHLNQQNLIYDLGFNHEVTVQKIIHSLQDIKENLPVLKDRISCQNPFDGKGCARIFNQLYKL